MIGKISLVLSFLTLGASVYSFIIIYQKKSLTDEQLSKIEAYKKEIILTEDKTKVLNTEHSGRYSSERAKNQDLEVRKLEVDRELQNATFELENIRTEIDRIEEDNDVLSSKIEEAKLSILKVQKDTKNIVEQRSSFAVSIPLIEQNKKDVLSEIENIKINSESLKDKLANYAKVTESLKLHYDSVIQTLIKDRNERNWFEKGEYITIKTISIDLKNGLIGLPVGKEQGVFKDKLFAIYKLDKEICKLRITHSEINKSVASIIPLIGDPVKLMNLDEFALYHL